LILWPSLPTAAHSGVCPTIPAIPELYPVIFPSALTLAHLASAATASLPLTAPSWCGDPSCLPTLKRANEGMAKSPKKAKRTPNAAFMKPVIPDEMLAKIVGDKPLPRTELTKKLWAYIRKNGLQDAKKKTLINADENLKAVFNGKKQVSMFEMTKLVSGHVKK
jgi:chromatin remodeling complex protein RSC6